MKFKRLQKITGIHQAFMRTKYSALLVTHRERRGCYSLEMRVRAHAHALNALRWHARYFCYIGSARQTPRPRLGRLASPAWPDQPIAGRVICVESNFRHAIRPPRARCIKATMAVHSPGHKFGIMQGGSSLGCFQDSVKYRDNDQVL